MPDSLQRAAALLSAILPVAWIGFLLVYAARGRLTAAAITTAFTAGFFSALTIGISVLTVAVVMAGGHALSLKGALAVSFLGAALPEEAAKLAVLLTIVYRHEDVQSSLDHILTAAWVGLGFAGLENIFYVFAEFSKEGQWPILASVRAATAVPSHTMLGVLMGILLARAFEARSHRRWWLGFAFLGPFVLHGLYNVCVFSFRDGPAGILALAERWHFALGLGAVMAAEAWMTVFFIRPGRARWDVPFAPPLKSGRTKWIGYAFSLLLILTMIVALGMLGLGAFGVWKQHSLSSLVGAGIAWIGIVYAMRLLRRSTKVNLSDLTPSPQVPISKDLASG